MTIKKVIKHMRQQTDRIEELQAELATAKEKNERLEGIIVRFKAGCKITGKGPVDKDCESLRLAKDENKRLREELETCEECGKTTEIEGGHHQCWCTACVKLFAGENKRLRGLLVGDRRFPLLICLKKLADAADHLLDDHQCDKHGYELVAAAKAEARLHISRIEQFLKE